MIKVGDIARIITFDWKNVDTTEHLIIYLGEYIGKNIYDNYFTYFKVFNLISGHEIKYNLNDKEKLLPI